MIKLIKLSKSAFARSRARRQIKFQPHLKDYTTNQSIKLQQEQLRHKFQSSPTSPFSEILSDPNPKPHHRFFIDKKSLNKKIKQVYKQQIKMQKLDPHDQNDLDYLESSKSYLYDQKQEIQFQEKFRQQMFRANETKRILGGKEKELANYLDGGKRDQRFLDYQDAKNALKNKKIENMMKMNRNNQQLELLIESGLFNNPDNINKLIQQLNPTNKSPMLEHTPSNPTTETSKISTTELVEQPTIEDNSLASTLNDIGPEQLKERTKVSEFIEKFEEQHESDKKACVEDLRLLSKIREYEQQVFLSRYEAINFRFKGRVDFSFFKQPQLMSYLKHTKIPASQLLTLYTQNLSKLSKYSSPIITPSVTRSIYQKTSLYKYPQTQTNNHINMLNDPKFITLQRNLFKNIGVLSDSQFCSAVWAYGSNHGQEQGLLKENMYKKINDVILQEIQERIFRLNDADLGLLCRGLAKLELRGYDRWANVVDYLGKRLPTVHDDFAVQSVMQFLLCLPYNPKISSILSQNLPQLSTHKWQQLPTLQTFLSLCGLLLKQCLSPTKSLTHSDSEQNLQNLQQILLKKNQQICSLLPNLPINYISQFLTVLRETKASLSPNMERTVNLCKKVVVDVVRMQKEEISGEGLAGVVGNFVLLDIQAYEHSRKSKLTLNQISTTDQQTPITRKLSLKSLLPFQPIPYNSSSYLIYHQLASLAHKEMHNLGNLTLARLVEHLSLSKYKNETLIDDISRKVWQTALVPDPFQLTGHSWRFRVKELAMIVNAGTFQKRINQVIREVLGVLFGEQYFEGLCDQSPYFLLRFITGVMSVTNPQTTPNSQLILKKVNYILSHIITPYLQTKTFTPEQQASIYYIATMLKNPKSVPTIPETVLSSTTATYSPQCKFIITFSNLLQKISTGTSTPSDIQKFQKAQDKFYGHIQSEIQKNQEMIGCPIPIKRVMAYLVDKIRMEDQGAILGKWTIQTKGVLYFVATYDHLMRREQGVQQGASGGQFQLFGVWRMYQQYARLRGLKLKLIISFLEGK